METMRINTVVNNDGQVIVTGLPFKKGAAVELTVIAGMENPALTAQQLMQSGLIGLWQARKGIGSSGRFARRLRTKAQQR